MAKLIQANDDGSCEKVGLVEYPDVILGANAAKNMTITPVTNAAGKTTFTLDCKDSVRLYDEGHNGLLLVKSGNGGGNTIPLTQSWRDFSRVEVIVIRSGSATQSFWQHLEFSGEALALVKDHPNGKNLSNIDNVSALALEPIDDTHFNFYVNYERPWVSYDNSWFNGLDDNQSGVNDPSYDGSTALMKISNGTNKNRVGWVIGHYC